jgi:Uma2 family endonuclease
MGAYPVPRLFTLREYLRIERAAKSKSEFIEGQIFAMAGGSPEHSALSMNIAGLLHAPLKTTTCQVHSSDLRIAVSRQGPVFYPDISVICGPPELLDLRRDTALNPVAAFEVLSRSTHRYDRETKVGYYKQIPTLRHIVLVSQWSVDVEHHVLAADGEWKTETLVDLAGTLELAALSARLPLGDIYARVALPAD